MNQFDLSEYVTNHVDMEIPYANIPIKSKTANKRSYIYLEATDPEKWMSHIYVKTK